MEISSGTYCPKSESDLDCNPEVNSVTHRATEKQD